MVKNNNLLQRYMESSNAFLGKIGAIEHNTDHAQLSANLTYKILHELGHPEREAELGAIAAYLHDIGNMVNRYGHGMSGAMTAFYILLDVEMDAEEIAVIMSAIGNHEEHSEGNPVNNVAAALILADKSNVHRSRVRKRDFAQFTARDRVNYAVQRSELKIDKQTRQIIFDMQIDNGVCSVMEFFEIFLTKMVMCTRAAEYLGCEFKLIINNARLL